MVQAKAKAAQKNTLHELGYKIFLDRYAQKDITRATLAVGDLVIVVVDSKTGQREIGRVTGLDLPTVTIELLDGETVTRDVEHVDKPIETDPGQMMDRVAAGVAAVEAGTATLLDMGARLYGLRKDCLDYPSTERVIRLELEHKAQRSADEDAALMRLKYASVPGNVLRPLMNQHKDAPRSELIPNGTAPKT